MHPYFGEDHPYSPTSIENVSHAETDITTTVEHGGTSIMNGQYPHLASYLQAQPDTLDIASLTGMHRNGFPEPMSIPAVNLTQMTTAGGGYMNSTPPFSLPPPSTAPSLYFRSPSTFETHSVGSMGTLFQFSSPTFSSPRIQMIAPRLGQTNCIMSSTMWQHTVPNMMPWAIPTSTPHTFSATVPSGPISQSSFSNGYDEPEAGPSQMECGKRASKRKMITETTECPSKVCINEERMAARMQELTLDNNNIDWHPNLEEEWIATNGTPGHTTNSVRIEDCSDTSDEDDKYLEDSSDSDGDKLPKLELSSLLQVGIKTKEILPKLILEEMNKPCMQLVLWKPPGEFVREAVSNVTKTNLSADNVMQINGDTNGVVNPSMWSVPAGEMLAPYDTSLDACLDVDLPQDGDDDMDL